MEQLSKELSDSDESFFRNDSRTSSEIETPLSDAKAPSRSKDSDRQGTTISSDFEACMSKKVNKKLSGTQESLANSPKLAANASFY